MTRVSCEGLMWEPIAADGDDARGIPNELARELSRSTNLHWYGLPSLAGDEIHTVPPRADSRDRRRAMIDALCADLESVRVSTATGARARDGVPQRRFNLVAQAQRQPVNQRLPSSAAESRGSDLPPAYAALEVPPPSYASLNAPPPYAPPGREWLAAFVAQSHPIGTGHG